MFYKDVDKIYYNLIFLDFGSTTFGDRFVGYFDFQIFTQKSNVNVLKTFEMFSIQYMNDEMSLATSVLFTVTDLITCTFCIR